MGKVNKNSNKNLEKLNMCNDVKCWNLHFANEKLGKHSRLNYIQCEGVERERKTTFFIKKENRSCIKKNTYWNQWIRIAYRNIILV